MKICCWGCQVGFRSCLDSCKCCDEGEALKRRVGACWRRAAGVDPLLSGQLQRFVAFAPGRVKKNGPGKGFTMINTCYSDLKCLLKLFESYSDTFGKTQMSYVSKCLAQKGCQAWLQRHHLPRRESNGCCRTAEKTDDDNFRKKGSVFWGNQRCNPAIRNIQPQIFEIHRSDVTGTL